VLAVPLAHLNWACGRPWRSRSASIPRRCQPGGHRARLRPSTTHSARCR